MHKWKQLIVVRGGTLTVSYYHFVDYALALGFFTKGLHWMIDMQNEMIMIYRVRIICTMHIYLRNIIQAKLFLGK